MVMLHSENMKSKYSPCRYSSHMAKQLLLFLCRVFCFCHRSGAVPGTEYILYVTLEFNLQENTYYIECSQYHKIYNLMQ